MIKTFGWSAALLLVALSVPRSAAAFSGEKIAFPLRGQTLTVTLYRPSGPQKGTIIMCSGDVGWVGLSVSLSELLSGEGWVVAGVNTRQYLAAFNQGKQHLEASDIPSDFSALHSLLETKGVTSRSTILAGVSEGAALMVVAAASLKNHDWIGGVVTMGTPLTAALAWNWTDFTTWITKKVADEPSYSPATFIGGIAPLPLVMIQSTKDEYVPEADYRKLDAAAGQPKRLVLIDASNHRFTDRQPQLRAEVTQALVWIGDLAASRGGRPQ